MDLVHTKIGNFAALLQSVQSSYRNTCSVSRRYYAHTWPVRVSRN